MKTPDALTRLLADYEHLAFPEDDAAVEESRRKLLADAIAEAGELRLACQMLRAACQCAADNIKDSQLILAQLIGAIAASDSLPEITNV